MLTSASDPDAQITISLQAGAYREDLKKLIDAGSLPGFELKDMPAVLAADPRGVVFIDPTERPDCRAIAIEGGATGPRLGPHRRPQERLRRPARTLSILADREQRRGDGARRRDDLDAGSGQQGRLQRHFRPGPRPRARRRDGERLDDLRRRTERPGRLRRRPPPIRSGHPRHRRPGPRSAHRANGAEPPGAVPVGRPPADPRLRRGRTGRLRERRPARVRLADHGRDRGRLPGGPPLPPGPDPLPAPLDRDPGRDLRRSSTGCSSSSRGSR